MKKFIQNLLREGLNENKRLKLEDETIRQIDNLLNNKLSPFIIKYIKQLIDGNEVGFVRLKIKDFSGEEKEIDIYIYQKVPPKKAGYHKTLNKNKSIVALNIFKINLIKVKSFIKDNLNGEYDMNEYVKNFIPYIKHVLIHELAHARDPQLNLGYKEKYDYDNRDKQPSEYYVHKAEVIAYSTTFLQTIISNVEKILIKHPNGNTKEVLNEILDNILNAFKTNNMNLIYDDIRTRSFTYGIFNSDFKNKTLKVINFLIGKSGINALSGDYMKRFGGENNGFHDDLRKISMLKKHNPDAWKKFLNRLYDTINEAKEKINKK